MQETKQKIEFPKFIMLSHPPAPHSGYFCRASSPPG